MLPATTTTRDWRVLPTAGAASSSSRRPGARASAATHVPPAPRSFNRHGRRPPSASRRARTAARAGAEIVRADPSCDDDDDECFFELGPDGRLAEPLEAAIPGDYYSLLQLDFDADPSEVKRQYRQLQKWCHPDIAGEAGTEVCIILNEAYDTLMDEKEREVYDRDLRELQKLANLAASPTPVSRSLRSWARIRAVNSALCSSTRAHASDADRVTTARRTHSSWRRTGAARARFSSGRIPRRTST